MKKISPKEKLLFSKHAKEKFLKEVKRRKRNHKLRVGWLKFISDIRSSCKKREVDFVKPSYELFRYYKSLGSKPEFSDTIKFLASVDGAFSKDDIPKNEDGCRFWIMLTHHSVLC